MVVVVEVLVGYKILARTKRVKVTYCSDQEKLENKEL